MPTFKLQTDTQIKEKPRIDVNVSDRPLDWSLKMSLPLRRETVTSATVKIYDEDGKRQPAEVRYNAATGYLEVSQGFVCDNSKSYYLEIGTGVHTVAGGPLKKPLRIDFALKSNTPNAKTTTAAPAPAQPQNLRPPVAGIKGELHVGEKIWVGHGSRLGWHFEPNKMGYISVCYDYYNGTMLTITATKFHFVLYDVDGKSITCAQSGEQVKTHLEQGRLRPGKWRVGAILKDAWLNKTAHRASVEKVEVIFENGEVHVFDRSTILITNNDQYNQGMA